MNLIQSILQHISKPITVIAFALLLFAPKVTAASASITLSSSAKAVTKGAHFEVTVNVESGSPISIAQAHLVYDKDKLRFVSESYSNTAWSEDTGDNKESAGYYRASRFKLPPFPTKGKLVVLTFEALDSNGTTSLTFDSKQSMIFDGNSGKNILSGVGKLSVDLQPESDTPNPGTTIPSKVSNEPDKYAPPSEEVKSEITEVEPATESEVAKALEDQAEEDKKSAESLVTNGGSSKKIFWVVAGIIVGLALLVFAVYIILKKNNKLGANSVENS